MEDWTLGELSRQIESCRRRLQTQAAIAYREAMLTGATVFSGGKGLPEVYEVFHFWTEDEVKNMKLSKYRAIMGRYVARGGGGK